MLAKIELRKAVPEDFKLNNFQLKYGAPYIIVDKDGHVLIHDVIKADLDLFVFKNFLEKGQVFVPLQDYDLQTYLKTQNDD